MAENFVAEAWSLLAIALVWIGLRIYARCLFLGFRKLAIDDALMVFAGILYTVETVLAYIVGAYWKGLANNSMTDEERAALDPNSEEWRLRVGGSKTQLSGWLDYTVLLWTLKFCWIFYYSRLTEGVDNMPLRIRIGYVILTVTFFATFFTILFGCYPVEKHWQINPAPGNRCQPANSNVQLGTLLSLNISTDLYLMSIPLPMIWKSRLSTRKKVILLCMFGGGFVVMVFGILRCTTILTSGAEGPEQAGRWSCRESFAAVIVGNMPMVYPLFQRWYHGITGTCSKASSSGSNIKLSSGVSSSKKSKRGKPFQHPLSIPNDTAWGSDEAIVTVDCKPPAVTDEETVNHKEGVYFAAAPAKVVGRSNSKDRRFTSGADIMVEAQPPAKEAEYGIHVVTEYSVEASQQRDEKGKKFSRVTFGPQ